MKDTIPAYEVQLQEEADCNDAIWCNLVTGHTTVIIGVVYRCPNITKQNNEKIHNAINEVSKGDCIIMGDFNHGNIKWDTLQSTGVEDSTFLCLVQDNFLTQHVLEPTRAARVLDIVLSSQKEFLDNVVIQEPLDSSDRNQLHFNIKIKSDKTKVKQCRRDFRKGNYKEIRKRLAHIDWNDKMKNKTATECWNILRGELDSAIDSFVPMKKQGKRSKKKHLSKEAFRKIRHKQNMWRVYKHTGKDQDYVVYKEALNAATNEVRKSKRNFELKLAQNIKSDSKSFYAYVRSKQNVRDKVGPLEDNAGDKITEGILMAEELNMHFSSVFTREDTSSLPVPETKFNGSEEERLGQLIVTYIVVYTETMATCEYCATGRLWVNSLATQGERGRPSGGISIGLNVNRNWLADKVFQSKHMVCVRTRVLAIVACYYPPNRDVSDILDDLADGIAKLSNCGTPILIAGDFNCRIDSGTRGHELSSALNDIGFTCHNDPAHHTYISKQGVSTIDLIFTDSVFDHKFRVDIRPALETKHQHVCVVFDDQLDKYVSRCDTIRRVDYATLERNCDIVRIGSFRVRSTNFLLNLRDPPPISMKFGTLADNA